MSENLIITNFDGVTFQDDYVPDCPICGMSHSKHPVDGEITFACGHYVDVYNEWFHDDEIRADAVKFATHAVYTSHVLGGLNEWFFDAKSDELNAVMTSTEIAEKYGIDDSTIRQAVRRGSLRARKSGNVLLVLRADADWRWGRNYFSIDRAGAPLAFGSRYFKRAVVNMNSGKAKVSYSYMVENTHHEGECEITLSLKSDHLKLISDYLKDDRYPFNEGAEQLLKQAYQQIDQQLPGYIEQEPRDPSRGPGPEHKRA